MKRSILAAGAAVALTSAAAVSTAAFAPLLAQPPKTAPSRIQTATLAIANMTCALCPVTVKRAMEGVAGVRSVHVNLKAKTATVSFDPSRTTTSAIARASANAGYPARATKA